MKQSLPTPWRVFPRAALRMAGLSNCLFLVSCLLLAAAPALAQDVLWGLTSGLGPGGAGTAFSIGSTGADFAVRKAFVNAPANPTGSLVLGRDGYFYGVTQRQHSYSMYAATSGTVYKVSPAGQLTVLKSFGYLEGAFPLDGLVEGRDGNFYGMTNAGGGSFAGTVFKISPTGAFTLLHSFNVYSDGGFPLGRLVEGSDGDFYGMTRDGGSSNAGTVFKISPTGAFTLLKSFDYADGAWPAGGLVEGRDGDFYGMTGNGGSNDAGTVFKISPTGAFTLLRSLDAADGAGPQGSLMLSRDGNFYGMTYWGGRYGGGTVFRMNPTGAFTVLKDFGQYYSDGSGPMGDLVEGRDGTFYGTTSRGGSRDFGTVFKISPTGTFTPLEGFGTHFSTGMHPRGNLVQGLDGDFYGIAPTGGRDYYGGHGTIFKISPAGTSAVVNNFDYPDGAFPSNGLMKASDGNFYGMTREGGVNNQGTFFKVSPEGTHTVVKDLSVLLNIGYPREASSWGSPWSMLVEGRDGDFYGVMQQGGRSWGGTIFKVSPTGTFTLLKEFDRPDGMSPQGSLVEGRDGNFYGVTEWGGEHGFGTVFKISPEGAFAVLKSFNWSDGMSPQGGLVEGSDGDFYGTTSRGSSNNYGGTIFKISPTGTYTVLKSFSYGEANNPTGRLVEASDGNFYGMTNGGNQNPAIFRISPEGVYAVLKEFTGLDGADPRAGLVEGSNGDLYGMTYQGGSNNLGTLFKISLAGTFTVLRSFSWSDGGGPLGDLFVEKPACTPPVLATVPANITVNSDSLECGASVALEAAASGTPSPTILYKAGDDVITSPHFFPVGTTTVTAIAVNGCGRVAKTFTVTVVDKAPPVPWTAALPDVTGECIVQVPYTPVAHDNCAGMYIPGTTTDTLQYNAPGTYTVTWTYRDNSGNASTQTQKVIVQDRTAPVPVLATLPTVTGECSVTATVPRATDNCAGSLTATTTDPTTYAAQGTYVIRWRYDDGRGNVTEQPQTVVVKDVTAPSITAPASLTLANDPGQCGKALSGIALGTPATADRCGAVKPATHDAPAFFPAGTTTVTWTVEDAAGNRSTATQQVTITNADPVVGTITAPVAPVGINTAVSASATFRDNNLTGATWDWGNGTTPGTIDPANGKITGSRTYGAPGVHTVTLTVTDACGKTATSSFRYVVAYDPSGGFVTGGGWFHSPANAYAPDPAVAGTAQFGFVSRYQKGATQPAGNTNFELAAAGLAFHSTAYEWLVVAGAQAQFKGAGTLNGVPGYAFLLTAVDAQVNGGTGADRFRIKIWKEGETVPVYDNQRGAADDAVAATVIGGGSILVHDDRSKARESADGRADAPVAAATLRGFPNPFTGKTSIEFALVRDEAYSLDVYDLNGRRVAALGAGTAAAGQVNRVVWEAKTAPAGMYVARLTTRSGVQHLKLVLR